MSSAEEDRLKRVQRQADEITDITRSAHNLREAGANINMSLERGEKLELMEEKADTLELQGRQFHANAVKLRRKFCMQTYRITFLIILILAAIGVVLYFIIKGV